MELLHIIGWTLAMFGAALIVLPPLLLAMPLWVTAAAGGGVTTFFRRVVPGGRAWKDRRFHGPSTINRR